jgi:hypothetical protein
MPKKPEKKLTGIPQFPIPIGMPWLVSQAIFEESLAFFCFYSLRSQLTFFLATSRSTVGELSGCQTKRRCENFERNNPYQMLSEDRKNHWR